MKIDNSIYARNYSNLTSNYKKNNFIQKNSNLVSFESRFLRGAEKQLSKKAIDILGFEISNLMNVETKSVISALEGASSKRARFFRAMAKRLNSGFDKNLSDSEGAAEIFKIFDEIKDPNRYHYYILRATKDSFKELSDVFAVATDRDSLKFANYFYRSVAYSRKNGSVHIINMLKSDLKEEFITNPDKYSSYFKLNFRNENAVNDLIALIKSGKFDQAYFDRSYNVHKLLQISDIRTNPNIGVEALEKGYSNSGKSFLESFFADYYYHRSKNMLPEINTANLLKMYASSNSDNIGLRKAILMSYNNVPKITPDGRDMVQSEIAQMVMLFERIDADKYTKSFLEKMKSDRLVFRSLDELNAVIDKFGSKKLDIYYENVKRILRRANSKDLQHALEKGIQNPFYETSTMHFNRKNAVKYGFINKENVFMAAYKWLREFYYDTKFKLLPDIEFKPQKVNYDLVSV